MVDPALSAALTALDLPPATAAERMAGYDATVWRVELADRRTVAVRMLRPGVSSRARSPRCNWPPSTDIRRRRSSRPLGAAIATSSRSRGARAGRSATCCWRRRSDQLGQLFGEAQARLHDPLDEDGSVLCHLDFQPFNVLFSGGRVTGIVDWANARSATARGSRVDPRDPRDRAGAGARSSAAASRTSPPPGATVTRNCTRCRATANSPRFSPTRHSGSRPTGDHGPPPASAHRRCWHAPRPCPTLATVTGSVRILST